MQHLPQIELARRALRGTICPTCYQRPHQSESLPPTVARSCEPVCPLFKHIDRLIAVAEASAAGTAHDYERAIRDDVCNKCCTVPTAGDYCGERFHAACPLSLFAGRAVAVLEALVEAETRASPRPHVRHLEQLNPAAAAAAPAAAAPAAPADDPLRWKGVLP